MDRNVCAWFASQEVVWKYERHFHNVEDVLFEQIHGQIKLYKLFVGWRISLVLFKKR